MTTDDQTIEPIETPIPPSEVVERLRTMSKRGKLAGFRAPRSASDPVVVDAHGAMFDSDLVIETRPAGTGAELHFEVRLRKKLVWTYAIVLLITIWPGLPLTDSFLRTFGWYERLLGNSLETWMWYLPFTIIPAPLTLTRAIKKSKRASWAHALETIAKIRAVLNN